MKFYISFSFICVCIMTLLMSGCEYAFYGCNYVHQQNQNRVLKASLKGKAYNFKTIRENEENKDE